MFNTFPFQNISTKHEKCLWKHNYQGIHDDDSDWPTFNIINEHHHHETLRG